MFKHIVITLLVIAITSACYAMESTTPKITRQKIIGTTITTIKEPASIICFPDNRVVIAGKNGCKLWDFSTNKEIIKFSDKQYLKIAAHPNKQFLAIQQRNTLGISTIKIYEIATTKKIGETSGKYWQCLPIFDPVHNTIIIRYDWRRISSFDYINNTHPVHKLEALLNSTNVIFNPKKQECILVTNNTLNILHLDEQHHINTHPFIKKIFTTEKVANSYTYNPDGSLIAINNKYGFSLLDTQSGSNDYCTQNNKKSLCTIAWHPNCFILATLSREHDTVCYWDVKNQLPIATIPLKNPNHAPHSYPTTPITQCMDFSCDGTKLIIARRHDCLILPIPFDTFCDKYYQYGTKKRCIFARWALQYYLHNTETNLPRDIICLLIKYLLAIAQYSTTDHIT